MSRRKQQKPRHLEAENDLAAILVDGKSDFDVPHDIFDPILYCYCVASVLWGGTTRRCGRRAAAPSARGHR